MVDQEKDVPFGYHIHTRLPEDKNFRISVDVANYEAAIKMFLKQVKRMVNHEDR